jgi:hypothetical protein
MSGQTKEAAPTTSKASTDELKEQELYEFFLFFWLGLPSSNCWFSYCYNINF